ncbi:AAA family ATPase [uncultured virus]|nr:AAA family ATPase [uncultured virus]
MPFELSIISGIASSARQYAALVHPETLSRYKISSDGYLTLSRNDRSLIVKVKGESKIPLDSIAIDPKTHAMTLYVAHGDKVSCSLLSNVDQVSKITVRLRKDSSIISYPQLKESLYVAPSYFIVTPSGPGVIEEGTGLYEYNPSSVMSELLTPATKSSSVQFKADSSKFSNEMMLVPDSLYNKTTTINIDFCHMGIGGLKEQMTTLIRQVLISRIINKSMRDQYKVKDIRGILLYGPPGTGKTLIARNIGKIIPNAVVQKVNGPELSSKFYGETEFNVRKIFDDAKADPNKLHVIIFDEIDAIGKKRGDASSNIDDKVLTQLLTMIDGLDSANNVLVIGITNRKDVLDMALTRAGRLECHIEIPLPTESGRKEILDICLNPLRTQNLALNIDSDEWARILDGYSGADIESLIGRTKNLALLRNCDIDENNIKPKTGTETLAPITNDDLHEALRTFQPTFSKNDDLVQRYITNYPLEDYKEFNALKEEAELILKEPMRKPYVMARLSMDENKQEREQEHNRIIVCHLANSLGLPYVRYISYNDFLGKNSAQNCNILNDAYISCLQAERAVLILDSLSDVGDRALILRERFITNNPLAKGKQLIIITINGIVS